MVTFLRGTPFLKDTGFFLVVDEEIAPLLCKALWVSRKALYKCNKLLLIIIIIYMFIDLRI